MLRRCRKFCTERFAAIHHSSNRREFKSTISIVLTKDSLTWNDFRVLCELLRPELPLMLGGLLMVSAWSVAIALGPYELGKIIDSAVNRDLDATKRQIPLLLLLYVGGSLSVLFRVWCFEYASHRFLARVRITTFKVMMEQEIAFFDMNRTGALVHRISGDTEILFNVVRFFLPCCVDHCLQLVGEISMMLWMDYQMTLLLFTIVPVVAACLIVYSRIVSKVRASFQHKLSESGVLAEESIGCVRTVKSFGGEEKAICKYTNLVNESVRIGRRLTIAEGINDTAVCALSFSAAVLILWASIKKIEDNPDEFTVGGLTTFLLYTAQMGISANAMSKAYSEVVKSLSGTKELTLLLQRKNKMYKVLIPVDNQAKDFKGEVSFHNVSFGYPTSEFYTLKNVNFKIEAGSTVALVGPSGGGKSTIISLMQRFYDPDRGIVMFGDHDLKEYSKEWLHSKMAVVGQEPVLFAGSIRDNISYGRQSTQEEIENAALQANAHDFICKFDNGYDTVIGERGARISGGQKQRIAIARALLIEPVLLLLDEATSALDAESEHLVQQAIEQAMGKRTVVIIAHRLSTVRTADVVLVISDGRVVEHGTHDQLLQKEGIYTRLVIRQLGTGTDPTISPRS